MAGMRSLGLIRKLEIWVACCAVASSVVIAAYFTYLQEQRMEADAGTIGSALASQVATLAVGRMQQPDEQSLRLLFKSLNHQKEVVYLALFSPDGKILYEQGQISALGLPEWVWDEKPTARSLQRIQNTADGRFYFDHRVAIQSPLAHLQGVLGYVRLIQPFAPSEADQRQLRGRGLGTGLVWGVFWAVSAVVVVRLLMRPFGRLIHDVMDIASGKSDQSLTGGVPETECLAAAFNELQTRLREVRREVVTHQLNFEERVKSRTSELHQAHEKTLTLASFGRAKIESLNFMYRQLGTNARAVHNLATQLLAVDLKSQHRGIAEALSRASQSLHFLMSRLSTPRGHKVEPESSAFQLERLIHDTSLVLAKEPNSPVITYLPDPSRIPDTLLGDSGFLHQILMSLIDAIQKYQQEPKIALRVYVESQDDTQCTLFFQLTTADWMALNQGQEPGPELSSTLQPNDFQGSGLILMAAQYFSTLLGGTLGSYTSSEPVAFWFTARFEIQSTEQLLKPEHLERLRGLHCLVVDTQDAYRDVLTTYLAGWGVTFERATNGRDACHMVEKAIQRKRPFDVALVEMIMPGLDGIELAQTLAPLCSHRPLRVLLLTTAGQHINTQKARQLGIFGTVAKPVRQMRLLQSLIKAMEYHEPAPSEEEPERKPSVLPQFDARILVAEDNSINQAVAENMLENLSCRVVLARTGQEACHAVQNGPFDLILMDIQMPEMDGLAAMKQIRSVDRAQNPPRHTPIVAVTANAVPGDREHYLGLGMDDYLSKPFDQDQLASLLGRWLTPKGYQRQLLNTPGHFSSQALDAGHLQKIRFMESQHGKDILEKLMEIYEEEAPKMLHALHGFVALKSFKAAGQTLHSLKSSSANLGAKNLSELCAKMEIHAQAADGDKLAEALVDLEFEHAQVRQAIQALRKPL